MTVEVQFRASCDGIKGPVGKRVKCPHGRDIPDHNIPACPTREMAIQKAISGNGYKRPHDKTEISIEDTTHLCCPDCWREYQRWNEVLPILP